MKKLTVILVAIVSFTLFSCGGNTNNKDSTKKETTKVETSKTEQAEQEDEDVFVKDEYEKDLGLKASENKYSQKDWDQISKVCKTFPEFENSTNVNKATADEWSAFLWLKVMLTWRKGKDDILRFKELSKIAMGLEYLNARLIGAKLTSREDAYKEACAEYRDEYNELNLSFEDLKNIEKYSKVIIDVTGIAMLL